MVEIGKPLSGLSEEKRRLLELRLGLRRRTPEDPIPSGPTGQDALASYAQQRIWFLQQLDPDGTAYSVVSAARIRGPLDTESLRRAVGAVYVRHDSLRTVFAEDVAGLRQVILPPGPPPWVLYDLSNLPANQREEEARRRLRREAETPLDLVAGPLFRALVVRVDVDDHVLVLRLHDAVTDQWSMGVLHRELDELYAAFRRGDMSPLPPLPIQYADYADWQRLRLDEATVAREMVFWRGTLASAPATINIPRDWGRFAERAGRGASLCTTLSEDVMGVVAALARAEGATLFMVLTAVARIVLGRHAAQSEIVLGTPVPARTRPELEGLIGPIENILPIGTPPLSGDPSFRELVRAEKHALLSTWAHSEFPFEVVLEQLRPPRDPERSPIVHAMITFSHTAGAPLTLDGCTVEMLRPEQEPARFELALHHLQRPDGTVAVTVEWAPHLWERSTIERLATHYGLLLEHAALLPDTARSKLRMSEPEERELEVGGWNVTRAEFPRGSVHRLFEAEARRRPGAVALEFGSETLSFAELNAQANRVARHLRSVGVGPEVRVGIAVERSPELVVAILAILKAGGAYVGIELDEPPGRTAFPLADADVPVLVVRDTVPPPLAMYSGAVVGIGGILSSPAAADDSWDLLMEADPDALAYVCYPPATSGFPRGIAVSHHAAVRRVSGVDLLEFGPDSVFLQVGPGAPDGSTLDLWIPLLYGGRLVLAPPGPLRPHEIAELVQRHAVTVLWLGTGLFHQLVDAVPDVLGAVRTVVAGGDLLSVPHVERILTSHPTIALFHGFGSPETGALATLHRVLSEDARRPSVPLGRPTGETRAYVLDDIGVPCPMGVPGELHIGGETLARGYLRRVAQTAERFIPDPFSSSPGARLYRTAIRVRRRENGALEFLRPLHRHITVRGLPVEPAEVEGVLRIHPAVRDAAVVAFEDPADGYRLAAYAVVDAGGDAAPAALSEFLATRLPGPSVPQVIVLLDALPLTPSGTVARHTLPAPPPTHDHSDNLPRTQTEELVAEIMAATLGIERVGGDEGFFELGGHSLLATRVVSRVRRAFGVELPLRALFEAPTVRGFAAHIDRLRVSQVTVERPPLVRIPGVGPFPLSFSQERIWFSEQMAPGTGLYNIPSRTRLLGPVDPESLRRAIETTVARHDVLRTRYRMIGGELVQEAPPAGRFELPLVCVHSDEEAAAYLDEEAVLPFDLEHGPLLRASLVQRTEREHILALTVHYSAADGWSWGLLAREISATYAALRRGESLVFPELPVRYADFAVWQRSWMLGPHIEADLAYWCEEMRNAPAVLELPIDRRRSPDRARRGEMHEFNLSTELQELLRAIARREGATLFMVLLAAYQVLLARWSGQADVVVGTPIAGRNRAELEGLVGLFVNMLPLRGRVPANATFQELLQRVRDTVLEAYAHQDLPFERLVEELKVERTLSHEPVFQVMFTLYSVASDGLPLAGLRSERISVSRIPARYDLTLAMQDGPTGLTGGFEYDTGLFHHSTIERLSRSFVRLLEAIVRDPTIRPLDSEVLDALERDTLQRWSRGGGPGPAEFIPVTAMFDAHVAAHPHTPAVQSREGSVTYAELDARANALAHQLVALGTGLETRVGVMMERTPEMIVSVLGTLKAGAAYVPLDPAYPPDRLTYMAWDAGLRMVLTTPALADRIPRDPPLLLVDATEPDPGSTPAPPAIKILPESTAYVIYTSGSTGRPKGVMIEHRSVSALVDWLGTLGTAEQRRGVLGATSLSFDVSVAEILGTLCNGGTLVLAQDLGDQLEILGSGSVHVAHFVPAAAAALARSLPPSLEVINLAGEAVPPALVDELCADGFRREIRNLYGPTECTVYATWTVLSPGSPRVSIGRPVPGATTYVLDNALRPVPIGVMGELFIGGMAVGRGYLGRPALTAERFLPDPFSDVLGARIFRTGDRVRWRPDGELEYLGRKDMQVKLRGFRIEPGEIESVLVSHSMVREAVVLVREDDVHEAQLVAYYVPIWGSEPDVATLRAFLREQLPEYMVPSALVALSALPLTANGKVDRAALPAPTAQEQVDFEPPATETETALAALWSEVLGLDRPTGATDSFFALGGHSLLVMRLRTRIADRFKVEISFPTFFRSQDLRSFAAELDAAVVAAREWRDPQVERLLAQVGVDYGVGDAPSVTLALDLRLDDGSAHLNRDYILTVALHERGRGRGDGVRLDILLVCDEQLQIVGEWQRTLVDDDSDPPGRVAFIVRPVLEGTGSLRVVFYADGQWCGTQSLDVQCARATTDLPALR